MEPDGKGAELRSYRALFERILADQGYTLESEIGYGGQAILYRCQHVRDNETYAVKIAREEDQVAVPAELLALQAVWDPHIINVYVSFTAEGFRFMILEFCPGGSLFDMIKDGPIPINRFWPLGKQIVDALKACHAEGVAHLDIKPQNILFDRHGRAKLCDFGLAKRTEGHHLSNQFKGSLAFMAPEIMRKHEYDPFKADVWSVGVTFYVALTGHLPWPTTMKEFLAGVARGLEGVDDNIPADLLGILKMMVEPDPAARLELNEVVPFFEAKCGNQSKFVRMASMRGPVGFSYRGYTLSSQSGADFLRLKYLTGDPEPNEQELGNDTGLAPRSRTHMIKSTVFKTARDKSSGRRTSELTSSVAFEL
jgi:serine/threonine protein kinase